MQRELTHLIDQRLNGALSKMAQDDARTPALQLFWLARAEAKRRGLLADTPARSDAPTVLPSSNARTREEVAT
jgi:hypothetical protein